MTKRRVLEVDDDDDDEIGRIVAVEDIKNGEECLMGSAVAYRIDQSEMRAGDVDAHSCDFEVDFDLLSYPEQLRDRRKLATPVQYGELQRSLSDEIVVLFGPNVSAALAIKMLRYLENRIKRVGLLVREDDEWETETVTKRKPTDKSHDS